MPKPIVFNGKTIVEPGAYSRVVGGETNPPDQASFGNVLIIDTGSMATYGFGSGITGDNYSGEDSIYSFNSLPDFRQAIAGSIIWSVAKKLFKPSPDQSIKGVDAIKYVRAATTKRGSATYTWTGGGAAGGTFICHTKVEGLAANGVLSSGSTTNIATGFAIQMVAGTVDTAKFKLLFYRGTFKGLDHNSVPWDHIANADSVMELLCESDEFSNVSELYAWAQADDTFNSWFVFDATSAAAGTGVVDSADLAASAAIKLFAGGTETYGAGDLLNVFKYIKELDYTYVLLDKYEDDAADAVNVQIHSHTVSESEFKRFCIVGGGKDGTKFTQADGSILAAAAYDSPHVHVCHSRVFERDNQVVGGLREMASLNFAAAYLGLIAGGEPQTPATWKKIDVAGVVHKLSKDERELALKSGVIHFRNVANIGLVINQDINTKQQNKYDIYEDGSSPHGSIMRIAENLNKSLTLDLRETFVGKTVAQASAADVKSRVETLLGLVTATKLDDNLILSFKGVKATLKGSDYWIEYGFTPNGPINRLFTTGFMFNVSQSA